MHAQAKISDFGLALRTMPLRDGGGWGAVLTPPRGTPGYVAPEMRGPKDAKGCVRVRVSSMRKLVVLGGTAEA